MRIIQPVDEPLRPSPGKKFMRIRSYDLCNVSGEHGGRLDDSAPASNCLSLKIGRYPFCRDVECRLLGFSPRKIHGPRFRTDSQKEATAKLPSSNFYPSQKQDVLVFA